MQCINTTERLLTDDLQTDAELRDHVAGCGRCAQVTRGLRRVDGIVRASLIVAPPLELQQQLAYLVAQAARPQPRPWWQQWPHFDLSAWLAQSPQMIGAQSLAALLVGLASWQIFGWLSAVQPVVGDVGYAMQLVAGSPAGSYLGGVQLDLQGLGLWSLVGLFAWMVSEDGFFGGGSRRDCGSPERSTRHNPSGA